MAKYLFMKYKSYEKLPVDQLKERSFRFNEKMQKRRTVRTFSNGAVPMEVIKNCLKAAGSAPSGANKQPWHFAVVTDPQVKRQIRKKAEFVEKEFYQEKAPQEWLDALAPLGTNENKQFLEDASCLIVIFEKKNGLDKDGNMEKYYYTRESIGIATGFLIAALHTAGLACLTYTPSPMGFLNSILNRPENERPFLVLVTGYPSENVTVPDITRKSLKETATFI